MTIAGFDRRLTAALFAAIFGTAVLAAIAAFAFSYREAQEIQDDALRQVAAMAKHGENTSETPISVMRIPPDPPPSWTLRHRREGFHTIATPSGSMRAYIAQLPGEQLLVVTQDTLLRQDVALGSALQALVPVLLLIPLVSWLTLRAVHAERAAIERQRRFIAAAAHELRTPLTAMSIQAGNIERSPDLASARDRLGALRAGIERARRVSDQLLALAQLQTAREPRSEVDMVVLIRELIADAMPLALSRAIDLGLEERAKPTVVGAPGAMRLAIANGIDNALRYAPEGTAVTVRLMEDAIDVIVDIEDAGPGIPEESRARVFEPFQRLGNSAGGGAGLGLAIARDAAQRQGGSVELLDGAGGRGLLFRYRQRRLVR